MGCPRRALVVVLLFFAMEPAIGAGQDLPHRQLRAMAEHALYGAASLEGTGQPAQGAGPRASYDHVGLRARGKMHQQVLDERMKRAEMIEAFFRPGSAPGRVGVGGLAAAPTVAPAIAPAVGPTAAAAQTEAAVPAAGSVVAPAQPSPADQPPTSHGRDGLPTTAAAKAEEAERAVRARAVQRRIDALADRMVKLQAQQSIDVQKAARPSLPEPASPMRAIMILALSLLGFAAIVKIIGLDTFKLGFDAGSLSSGTKPKPDADAAKPDAAVAPGPKPAKSKDMEEEGGDEEVQDPEWWG